MLNKDFFIIIPNTPKSYMKYASVLLLLIIALSCKEEASEDNRKMNFPMNRESVAQLPEQENLWLFVMAGQSNMAGRGLVEPADTLSDPRIFSLDQNNQWVYAKEPLHFYGWSFLPKT